MSQYLSTLGYVCFLIQSLQESKGYRNLLYCRVSFSLNISVYYPMYCMGRSSLIFMVGWLVVLGLAVL